MLSPPVEHVPACLTNQSGNKQCDKVDRKDNDIKWVKEDCYSYSRVVFVGSVLQIPSVDTVSVLHGAQCSGSGSSFGLVIKSSPSIQHTSVATSTNSTEF